MFCSKCGCQNPEGVRFCQRCGSAISGLPIHGKEIQQDGLGNSMQVMIKKEAGSPLFLTGVIAFTAWILFRFLSVVIGNSSILYQLRQYAYQLGMDAQSQQLLALSNGTSVISLIGMIPEVLVAIGLWMLYVSGHSRQGGLKTAGLTIIKVLTIIGLVGSCIVFLFLEILFIIAVFAAGDLPGYYGYGSTIKGIIVLCIIFVAVYAFLHILYNVLIVKSINTVKYSALSGIPSDKISMYVAVICFIVGFFWALGGLFSIMTPLVMFTGLSRATAKIMFGAVIVSYRNKMRLQIMQANRIMPDMSVSNKMPSGRMMQNPPEGFEIGQNVQERNIRTENPVNTGETTVLNSSYDEGTTVLRNENAACPRLIRIKNGASVNVNLPELRIGKDPTAVDLYIGDNTAVSRMHASVVTRQDGYYVVDHNSTNHVYVNGQMIQPDVLIPVGEGTRIRLADEEFLFTFK